MDYILCYKSKKRQVSKDRLSISSNGGVPLQTLGKWEPEGEAVEAAGPGDIEDSKLTEEEKALMRADFEAGLVEAGLQIERDKEVRLCFPQCFYTRGSSSVVSSDRCLWVRAQILRLTGWQAGGG